jgi:tRNA threonylcarbamoyladenosine biosynthesis protein TsaB
VTVLAIDTSSRSRVVCLLATPEGELVDSEVIRGETVAASLPQVLGRMLVRVDRAVVVVTGPGTYTGVRAGMAAALGIAHAQGLPLHGVGSLEVVAAAVTEAGDDGWVVADAGRGAMYAARTSDAAAVSRLNIADFEARAARVFSSEPIAISGVVTVDPAQALARAVVLALARAALDPAGLSALYVD